MPRTRSFYATSGLNGLPGNPGNPGQSAQSQVQFGSVSLPGAWLTVSGNGQSVPASFFPNDADPTVSLCMTPQTCSSLTIRSIFDADTHAGDELVLHLIARSPTDPPVTLETDVTLVAMQTVNPVALCSAVLEVPLAVPAGYLLGMYILAGSPNEHSTVLWLSFNP